MKNTSIFSTALLLLVTFFVSQTAQAQWSQNTTSIYPTTLTKKVGIGTSTPVEARPVVAGSINQTVAMFGQGAPGISLTTAGLA